jgi:ABC-type uncharacterized transport system substrate-binding protein
LWLALAHPPHFCNMQIESITQKKKIGKLDVLRIIIF